MQTRVLGESGLKISAIGFGCMGLNFSYGHSLSKAAAEIQVEGERYPEQLMASTGL